MADWLENIEISGRREGIGGSRNPFTITTIKKTWEEFKGELINGYQGLEKD